MHAARNHTAHELAAYKRVGPAHAGPVELHRGLLNALPRNETHSPLGGLFTLWRTSPRQAGIAQKRGRLLQRLGGIGVVAIEQFVELRIADQHTLIQR